MKTSRLLIFIVLMLLGFFAARWGLAQSAAKKPASYDFGALDQLASFVSYLQEMKQTNILERFYQYENASMASRDFAAMGITVHLLKGLREGHTNEAYELLEGQLNQQIIGFVNSYRELPASLRGPDRLKLLAYTRDYRTKYPFKHRYADVDKSVAEAFKVLDEKGN